MTEFKTMRFLAVALILCARAPSAQAQVLAPLPGPPWIRGNAPSVGPSAFKPRIEPHEDWDGPPPKALEEDSFKRVRIVVHHTGVELTQKELSMGLPEGRAAAIAQLRSFQAYHQGKGWTDIGYHYLIDWQGRIWQGRPLWALGANTLGHNEGTIGIALMGDFEHGQAGKQKPTDVQLGSLKALLAWLVDLKNTDPKHFGISPDHISGHHAWNDTDCPGCNLENEADPNTPLRRIRLELMGKLPRGSTPDPPARLFQRTDLGPRRDALLYSMQAVARQIGP